MANPDLDTIIQGVRKESIVDLLIKIFPKLFPNKFTLDHIKDENGHLFYRGQRIYFKSEIDDLISQATSGTIETITQEEMEQAIEDDKITSEPIVIEEEIITQEEIEQAIEEDKI